MTPPKQLTAVSARVLVQLSPIQLIGVSACMSHLRLKKSNYEEDKISRFRFNHEKYEANNLKIKTSQKPTLKLFISKHRKGIEEGMIARPKN